MEQYFTRNTGIGAALGAVGLILGMRYSRSIHEAVIDYANDDANVVEITYSDGVTATVGTPAVV